VCQLKGAHGTCRPGTSIADEANLCPQGKTKANDLLRLTPAFAPSQQVRQVRELLPLACVAIVSCELSWKAQIAAPQ